MNDYRGVVLISGGLDSATMTAMAINDGYDVTGLSFDYGQRHAIEIESSRKLCSYYGIPHRIIKVDLTQIGGSSLTSEEEPEDGKIKRLPDEIPNTYVPSRNMIFISMATAYAETMGCHHIFIGANAIDYSGYPDCRPEFFRAMEEAINKGTREGIENPFKLHVPLQNMGKDSIIRAGMELKVPYRFTHSCYRGGDKACGKCDSCLIRLKGFMDAGYEDPIEYIEYPDFYRAFMKK